MCFFLKTKVNKFSLEFTKNASLTGDNSADTKIHSLLNKWVLIYATNLNIYNLLAFISGWILFINLNMNYSYLKETIFKKTF